ncbi:MAG: transcriptional regulator BetI [Thiothrix sp.]|nr:transcriptional regulator BetI [Thiothrix sp.]HPQ97186.1 transcriptional regulator BetI [Thiolinea sp.]
MTVTHNRMPTPEHFDLDILKDNETPLRIVHSTLEEIGENGLCATTTKAISQRANLSTGIIHHYFHTKNNLVYAAYVYLVQDLHQNALTIFREQSDPVVRLKAIIHMNFSSVHISPEARDVWPQFWANSVHDERMARLLRAYYRRFRSNLVACFRPLLHDREAALQAAELLISAIHGVWFTHRVAEFPHGREQAIARVERQLELLLACSGGAS